MYVPITSPSRHRIIFIFATVPPLPWPYYRYWEYNPAALTARSHFLVTGSPVPLVVTFFPTLALTAKVGTGAAGRRRYAVTLSALLLEIRVSPHLLNDVGMAIG
ncbi:hypothetical protein BJY52DRAFT_1197429 [Lactarius psammicola]|nr:hypothetical protein BJY52DRAFT_1197429 [Lactarius psammicola]